MPLIGRLLSEKIVAGGSLQDEEANVGGKFSRGNSGIGAAAFGMERPDALELLLEGP